MRKYFKGKNAIVTGGASGIGRALCLELGKQGAIVTVTDVNAEGAEQVAGEIESSGGSADSGFLDVTKADEVREFVEKTASEKDCLDFMFNNAGIVVVGELKDTLLEDWRKLVDINLMGVVHGMHAAYAVMIKQGHGHIVNTASASGFAPTPLFPAYSAMKHAIVGLTTAACTEAASLGVRVSAFCPWIVDTPLFTDDSYRSFDKEGGDYLPKLTPEYCARVALKGVAKNKAIIPVGLESKAMYYSYRLFPNAYMFATKIFVKQARNKFGKK